MGDRRRRRVQGAWSQAAPGSSADRPRSSDNHGSIGKKLGSKYLLFRDPKESKMPARKPYNCSWVVPGLLAGSGLPRNPAEVQYFIDEGVDILVSLTEWKPALHLAPGLEHIHMPVAEFEPPSLKQASDFVALVEKAAQAQKKVAVHCHWGRGRTGSMIACYLIKSEGLSAEDAICKTRHVRPFSVETYEQERLVRGYYDLVHKDVQ